MKFFVCVAGLSHEAVEELSKRSAAVFTEDKTNPVIVRPLNQQFAFRPGMSKYYLGELVKRFQVLPPREDVAILLAYVRYGHQETSRFVRDFFPFALASQLEPFYPNSAPKNERRHQLLDHIAVIETVVGDLRKRARVVRDVFSGQNFHPLLLPLCNFKSDVLGPQVEALFNSIGTVENPRGQLDAARAAILTDHPLYKSENHTPFFQDNRDLRFKSPGKNRHGFARRVGTEHQDQCLLSSRVRLGGPFDALFHYDCDYEHRSLDASYPNCHGVDTPPGASTHVNIAPNDAIR